MTLTATTPWPGSAFSGWGGACGGTEASCVLELASAANVVATFTYTGSDVSYDWVQDAYISYYGRPADPEGQAYWAGQTDLLGRGLDAIVGAFGTSDEFNSRYGGLTNTELVTKIYQQTLARNPDPGGLAWYVAELAAGRKDVANDHPRCLVWRGHRAGLYYGGKQGGGGGLLHGQSGGGVSIWHVER